MMEPDASIKLLEEIRNLLKPISYHYQGEYDQWLHNERENLKTSFAKRVIGKQSRAACRLMDGSHSRAEIRQQTGMASGNLSVLIGDLRDLGLIEYGRDGDTPALILSSNEVTEAFS